MVENKEGSTKPVKKTKKVKPEEIEKLILKYAKEGKSASLIGVILRDKHGVKSISDEIGKSILTHLKENKMAPRIPEDLENLIRSSVKLVKHMETNKKDMTAKRGYILTVSKIRRLAKYYKNKGVLPKNWRYTKEKAALLVR